MAFNFPSSPLIGQAYTSGGVTYYWNGYGWSAEPLADFVDVSGDTMTGSLTIRTNGSDGHLIMDQNVIGDAVPIYYKRNNRGRWQIRMTTGPEPGGNVGSDLTFRRFDDAGTMLGDIPFRLNRSTGRCVIGQTPVDPMDVANKAFVEAVMGGGGPEHVLRTGDVMTGTLQLPQMIVDAPAGGQADIWGRAQGAGRWLIRLTDNFELHRYADNGAYLGSPHYIRRSDGYAHFVHDVGVVGSLSAGYLSAPGGYISTLTAINTSISNCSSNGTFNLTTVSCQGLSANSITDYGALVVHGAATVHGTTYARNIEMNGSLFVHTADGMHSSIFTRQTNGELGIWIVDRQDINVMRIEMVRGVWTDGSRSFTIYDSGNVYGTYGYCAKAGIYGGPRGNSWNFDWGSNYLWAWVDNTVLGAVAFQSDYRIKRNIADLASTWQQVKKLRPVKYNMADFDPPVPADQLDFGSDISSEYYRKGRDIHPARVLKREESLFKADDVERWGFIAHELQETLLQSAATGVKDDPVHVQSPDPWPMFAALTKALQEAMTRIEMMEVKLGIHRAS